MKKILFNIATAGVLVLSGCDNAVGLMDADEPRAASVTAQIGDGASRAAGTDWAAGDAIGVSGVSGEMSYDNIRYITESGNGNFAVADAADNIYYHTTGPVTFTAYYPFTGSNGTGMTVIAGDTRADKQTAESQPAIDYLWAQAVGSYAEPAVNFRFDHMMSRLTLTFTNGNDVDMTKMTAYSVGGLVAEGVFNPATGEAHAADSAEAENLVIEVSGAGSGVALPPMIVYPQSAGTMTIGATIDGQSYICTLSPVDLEAGMSYNFNVKVSKTGLTVSGSEIIPWVDGGSVEGEASLQKRARKGDWFYSDGTYSTNQVAGKTPVGIVFWTPDDSNAGGNMPASLGDDKIMGTDFPECTHGLVVALKNAAADVEWQSSRECVYQQFQETDNFNPVNKSDYQCIASDRFGSTGAACYVLGYQNTKVLLAYNEWCAANDRTDYAVKAVDAITAFANENPAPAGTTGWYLPSVKELHLLCYRDVDDIYNNTGSETKDMLNPLLEHAGGDRLTEGCWSSTEVEVFRQYAFSGSFSLNGIHTLMKNHGQCVRAVLAF